MSHQVHSILDPKPLEPTDHPTQDQRGRRIRWLFSLAVVWMIVWTVLVVTLEADRLLAAIVILTILGSVAWVLPILLKSAGEPFFTRQIVTGLAPVLLWCIVMMIVVTMTDNIIAVIVASGLVTLALLLAGLMLPVWVIEIDPGEVYYYRSVNKRPTQYHFITCPLGSVNQPTNTINITEMAPVVQFRQSLEQATQPPPQVQPSDVISRNDFRWIRPLDDIRLFWRLNEYIYVTDVFRDLTTHDGMSLDVRLKLVFKFDPQRIRNADFAVKVPEWKSMGQVKQVLEIVLKDSVDLMLRQFYIGLPFDTARTTGSVNDLRAALPEKLAWAEQLLGITLQHDMTNIDPRVDHIVRQAASHDAARHHVAQAGLAVTDGLVERAASGSLPAQLILYAHLFSNPANLNMPMLNNQMPDIGYADRLMYSLQAGDEDAKNIIYQMLHDRQGGDLPIPPLDREPPIIVQDANRRPPLDSPTSEQPPSETHEGFVIEDAPPIPKRPDNSPEADSSAAHPSSKSPTESKKKPSRRSRRKSINLGDQADN